VTNCFQRKISDPANELPVGNITILKKEVTSIKWNILTGITRNRVVMQCSDRSSYAARHAIVTVSLGVLKEKAESMFYPALPEEKLNAIKVSSKYVHILKTFNYFFHEMWSMANLYAKVYAV
jgi:hypothetical protein